jgi:RES domain-containing protein
VGSLIASRDLAFGVDAAQLSHLAVPVFYRSVSLRVMAKLSVHPLDGMHAGRAGGRYNPPRSEPTLYLAGTQTLAVFECEHEALALALPSAPLEPRVTFAVSVENARVLDLTQELVRVGIGAARDELIAPTTHWQRQNRTGTVSITQQIGETARARPDVDGLLVPSWLGSLLSEGLLPRTNNLVLFMDPAHPRKPRRDGVTLAIHDPNGVLPRSY